MTYDNYLTLLRQRHGDKFSDVSLARKFIPYFGTGTRIKVRMRTGEVITGTVSGSTGWQPVFLLMRRSTSIGSSDVLNERDEIIAVKRGRKYVDA